MKEVELRRNNEVREGEWSFEDEEREIEEEEEEDKVEENRGIETAIMLLPPNPLSLLPFLLRFHFYL